MKYEPDKPDELPEDFMSSHRLRWFALLGTALSLVVSFAGPAIADKPKGGPIIAGTGTTGPFYNGTDQFDLPFDIYAETDKKTTDFSVSVAAAGDVVVSDPLRGIYFHGDVTCVLFHSTGITVGGNIAPDSASYATGGPYYGFVAFIELATPDHLEIYGSVRWTMYADSCFPTNVPIGVLLASGDIGLLPGKNGLLP